MTTESLITHSTGTVVHYPTITYWTLTATAAEPENLGMRGGTIAGIVLVGLSVLIFLITVLASCIRSKAGPASVEEEDAGGETEGTENGVTSVETAGVVIDSVGVGSGIHDLVGCCRVC